ncbi:MAG: ABC transporter ATP-binding protein [Hespellia sp.]|nr:ABC transporter ATP-binding protein [Hespellia sp.]
MIEISNLYFRYTKDPFIRNINFSVDKGEIFGFLGPSGAGKSTIQQILIGMLPAYEGSVVVNGVEVRQHDNRFYENIGVDFEYPSLYEKLTARQNLDFFASLYSGEKYQTEELLSSVGLLRDADKKVSDFSKGMKSRLNFAKALIHKPEILFLDEPTSGLDPSNAREMKDMILEQKALGTTIILTTHNMEDAAELCDRVAFIVDGEIRAIDEPHRLIMKKGAKKIQYSYLEDKHEKQDECLLDSTAEDEHLQSLLAHNQLLTIHSSEPSLGDIFMDLTGRRLS